LQVFRHDLVRTLKRPGILRKQRRQNFPPPAGPPPKPNHLIEL